MAKSTQPSAVPQSLRDLLRQVVPQSLRDLQRQIEEDAERWREHPLMREDQEKLRQWAEALRVEPPQSQPTAPKRKHAGGAPPKLTADEVASLQTAYRAVEPTVRRRERKQSDVFGDLRKLLPKGKRGIGDFTLRRIIVRPLRRP